MKKVLVILGNHSPEPSSVANSVEPLLKRISESYSVDIITNRKRLDIKEYEQSESVNIYRIDDYRVMNTFYLNELNKIKFGKLIKYFTKIISFISKSLFYLRYSLLSKEKLTSGWEKKRVIKKIIELDKINDYELVISISQPFHSHFIAEEFKNYKGSSLKWLVYEFDPYSYNDQISNSKLIRRIMFNDEKRIFSKCDIICLTPELYEFYKTNDLFQFYSKVKNVPYSSLKPIKIESDNGNELFLDEYKINCLYTGNLYPDIRQPDKLLEVFSELDTQIQLVMMTNYSSEKINNLSPSGYKPKVINFQDRETALYNLINTDILINIGNTNELQVPGKIFEYMSTGKPIIHFSKIKNDAALKYFSKYPNVLIIDEWDYNLDKIRNEVTYFCKNNLNNTLSFEEVRGYLVEYSSKTIQNNFIEIIDQLLA